MWIIEIRNWNVGIIEEDKDKKTSIEVGNEKILSWANAKVNIFLLLI